MAWLHADWTWRVLSPFLHDDDALSLSLFAMETQHRALWRFLAYEDTTPFRRPQRGTRLLHLAIAHGCWRAARTVHDELLRGHYDGGSRDLVSCDISALQEQLTKHGLRYSDSMAAFLRRMHYAPVELPAHVVYEACHRGHLDAVVWLHEVSSYDPHIAVEWAARGKHMELVRWVLTNRKTAQRIQDGVKMTWTLKGKEAKALGGFYAWNVEVADERTTYAYCASREHGLLPRKNVKTTKTLYPLKTWAAMQGDLELFERLHEQSCGREMSTTEAVTRAAECGHLAIVQWFFEIERPVHKDIEEVTLAALGHGHLHIIEWLYEEDYEIEFPLSARLTVRAGGFAKLDEWLDETFPDTTLATKMRSKRTPLWDNFVIEAANNGLLDVVKFLHEDVGCAISIRALGNAATRGHLEVLQWLWSKQPPSDRDLQFVLSRAVAGGSLKVVRWLVGDIGLFQSSALKLAVTENHVAIAEYLLGVGRELASRNNIPVQTVLDFNIDLADLISEGRFEALDWLLSNVKELVMPFQNLARFDFFLTLERYHDENEAALRVRNAEFDRKRLFQWAAAAAQPRAKLVAAVEGLILAIPEDACTRFEWIPKWAMKTGSRKVIQALARMQHASLFWYPTLMLLLQSSCDVSLVQWYLAHDEATLLVEEEMTRIVRWAAKYNHVDLLVWLLARSEELATFRTAAWTAAKHGHVHVLQCVARYLESNNLTQYTDFCRRIWRGLDIVAAENGHIGIIGWVWTKTGVQTVLADTAAKHNQLRVLRWLHAKDETLARCSVRAVCCAVGKGHAEVVGWLLKHQAAAVEHAYDSIPSLQAASDALLTEWKAN